MKIAIPPHWKSHPLFPSNLSPSKSWGLVKPPPFSEIWLEGAHYVVVVLKDIILCLLGFIIYMILYIRRFKCFTTTNMLFFWSTCLPVCQSNFNGWFRSQGKYRATLEFKSSGCAVRNNLIYDLSLNLSFSVKVIPKSFDTCLNST